MVELLGKARGAELETADVYQALGYELKTFDGNDVAEELAQDAGQEFTHADQFAKKIDDLGHRVSEATEDVDYSRVIPDDQTDVEHVVKGVYSMERDAVEMYGELVDVAAEAGYPDVRSLAETQQADEREHLAEFRDLAVHEYGIDEEELEEFYEEF
jgi:ferritin-like protein